MLACTVHAATINGISVSQNKSVTRITFIADQALDHTLLILDNPKRLVLDLKNTPLDKTIKALGHKQWPKNKYIKKTRVGLFEGTTARIVLDLRSEVKSFINTEIEQKKHTSRTKKLSAQNPQYILTLDILPPD